MWAWAEVESSLFTIYLAAIGGLHGDMRPAREAHFAVNSFEMRLIATDAAVKQRWEANKPQLELWQELYDRATRASKQPGRIADRLATIGHHRSHISTRSMCCPTRFGTAVIPETGERLSRGRSTRTSFASGNASGTRSSIR